MTVQNNFSIRSYKSWSAAEKAAFLDGIRAMDGYAIAVATWGLVAGVAMAKSALALDEALGMSLLVYAGSAQLASLPLIANSVPIWSILLTAVILNLRFVIYSAGVQAHFRQLSLRHRILFGFFSGDISFIVYLARYPSVSADPLRIPFYFGVGFSTWFYWQVSSVAGIFLAGLIPNAWGLSFAGILTLIAVVVPMIDHGSSRLAAVAAGVVASATTGLPYKLNVLLAVIAAILVGMGIDKRDRAANMNTPIVKKGFAEK